MADNDHRSTRTRRRDQRGSVLVEFALCSLLFLGLIYGTVSWGVIFWVKSTVTHAAEEGARAAVVGGATSAGTKATSVATAGLGKYGVAPYMAASDVTSTSANCPDDPSATCVTVTVKYRYKDHPILPALAPVFPLFPDEIKSTSIIQIS